MICVSRLVIRGLFRLQKVRRLVAVVILLTLATASLPRTACAETLLRWKFAEGQRLQVTVHQHITTETTGAGKPTGIEMTMQFRMTWRIDSVDLNGTAQMTQQFDRFELAMKSGSSEPIAYASDSETKPSGAAADIAASIAPVIGAEFFAVMTNRGEISSVKLSEAAAGTFASIESQALQQLFSAEGISRLLSQSVVELPEQAVATDSQWSMTFTTPSPLGTLKQARVYTLAAQEDMDGTPLERINLTGKLEIEPSDEAPGRSKLVDQALTGTMYFDSVAGRLVRSQSVQRLSTERLYREFKIKVATTASTTTTISSQ